MNARNRHGAYRARRLGKLMSGFLATMTFAHGQLAMAEQPTAAALPGKPALFLGAYDVTSLGYELNEFTVTGQARSYTPQGSLGSDGNWRVKPDAAAPYKTRVVVLKPADPAKFNGSVIVEWMNVTGGLDVPVEWVTAHRELVRRGYAYVGVSAQKVGIDGGLTRAGGQSTPLKKADPARYASLVHPGDAFSYDMFSDVGRLLRSPQRSTLLGNLAPKRLLAVGESQSAAYLTTYVLAADPLAKVYDGFLIHSRTAVAAPLDSASPFAVPPENMRQVRMPKTLRVPVLQLITETDLLKLGDWTGFHAVRQPDTPRLRTWEVAGTAHADNYLYRVGMFDTPSTPIEQIAAAWQPMDQMQGQKLARAMNNGPQHHYVTQAAIAGLDRWVASGKAPPHGPEVKLGAGDPPTLVVDAHGNAIGGVRSPWVDVPLSRLTGDFRDASSMLTGHVAPFDAAKIARLYPGGKAEYLRQFTASLDRAIGQGFILPEDRSEIVQLAELSFEKAAAAR